MATPNKTLDFLIIGVGKSGTTSLAALLDQHPDIIITDPKEPWFFDSSDYRLGMQWYWSQYLKHYRGEPCVGEASSHTLFVPYAAQRLYDVSPDVRLIALLRNPVERAHSDWWMKYCQGTETDDFASAIEKNLASLKETGRFDDPRRWQEHIDAASTRLKFKTYVDFGCYASQLERLFSVFPRHQVMVILTEDLRDEPLRTLGNTCRFLNVSAELGALSLDLTPRNPAGSPRAAQVRRALHALPGGKRLSHASADWLPEPLRKGLRAPLKKLLQGDKPAIPMATRNTLNAYFSDEILRLETLIGRDLSAWKPDPLRPSPQTGSG